MRVEERFWAKVDRSGDCWLWTASGARGYGVFWCNSRKIRAHRYAYELLVGPIPVGLQLDHLCRVRNCVNPAHLEPVTQRENVLRGVGATAQHAKQTHCTQGHEFTAENVYLRTDGGRECRICKRRMKRAWYRASRVKILSLRASLPHTETTE